LGALKAATPAQWAAVVDGDDNLWIPNFARGQKTIRRGWTGAPIPTSGGHVGGEANAEHLALGQAGDVWAMDNWQPSTLCGGQGVTVSFGMSEGRCARRKSGRTRNF